MNQRIRPKQHLTEVGRRYPTAWRQVDTLRAARTKDDAVRPDWCFVPYTEVFKIVRAAHPPDAAAWDLVDALADGEVDEAKIVEMEEQSLPEPMQALNAQERMDFVKQKARERKELQRQILELSESRADYVADKKAEMAVAAPSVSDALTDAIKKQAVEKNFTLEN